jgi:hypothetical protein
LYKNKQGTAMNDLTTTHLTREYVSEQLSYDAETGELRWKVAKSNCIKAGQVAGSIGIQGYLKVKIDRKLYQAHRVAWLLANGAWPEGHIDHINGVRSDNRIANLRVCSNTENVRNAKMRRDNTSGIKGVFWHKASNAWCARVSHDGRMVNGGTFKNIEDAKHAAIELREKLHGDFANHGEQK